jgi:hypothetical protein
MLQEAWILMIYIKMLFSRHSKVNGWSNYSA